MTTPPSSLPPANWYPDPQTPGQLRYWDGQRWTQHVHPAQQAAQGVGGAGAAQVQAGPGVFLPSGRPGSAQPGQGGAAVQGGFTPVQAGPSQGGFSPTQAAPLAVGPSTGAQRTFQPGGAVAASPFPPTMQNPTSLDVDDIPETRGAKRARDPYDSVESTGSSTASKFASLFGFLALLATAASVYGLGTDFDAYVTYAAGGLGFVAVLLGFAGVGKAVTGEGGRGRSILAICLGFLAIGLATYEYLNPHALFDVFAGFFPK
ncbi:MAG TPA: DUF2510 domain-containing protein [Demequinaceae bacterium]